MRKVAALGFAVSSVVVVFGVVSDVSGFLLWPCFAAMVIFFLTSNLMDWP